jgi:hypothetical protein
MMHPMRHQTVFVQVSGVSPRPSCTLIPPSPAAVSAYETRYCGSLSAGQQHFRRCRRGSRQESAWLIHLMQYADDRLT